MSTLGQLFALSGQNMPLSYTESMKGILSNERQESAARTDLLTLADLERQQQTQAAMREYYRLHPEEALGLQSTLGGGMPPGPPAGGGPLMQQQVVPGQPPGAPQVVPGGQDLSRFAGVSPQGGGPMPPNVAQQLMPQVTPPMQSTLGAPGPQQAAPQQNPLVDLVRRDPAAGMAIQARMQAMQEKRLTNTITEAEYAGRILQGVTNQASYDDARREIGRNLPQLAAQLPPAYSAEAIEPFIARATTVKDRATLEVQGIQARAELQRARMSGRVATTDQYLKALGVTPGQEKPEDMQRAIELQNKHLAEIEAGKVNAQIVPGPGGEYWMVNPRTGERRPVGGGGSAGGAGTGTAGGGEQLRAPMTEGQAKTAGYTSRMQTGQEQLNTLEKSGDYATWKLPLTQLPGGRLLLSDKQKEYENAKGIFLAGLLRYDSAGQITEPEWKYYGDLYFPQYGDEPAQVEQKRQFREQAIKTHQEMLGRPVPGQKASTQAPPTSQGTTGSGGQAGAKVVTRAALHAEAQRRNISPEKAEELAKAKGYTVQ